MSAAGAPANSAQANAAARYAGSRVQRVEDARLLTGAGTFLRDNPSPTDQEIRDALSGNLCRCTGYQGILAAVRAAADTINQETR